ncbi:MAG TPA: sigma-70 family RNA polymerase sigma factor [Longimicrobiaceae bacterium]|nr:sigma-70 family RNA polymerase sigma factor [Longimicrobiaceae bacterium]
MSEHELIRRAQEGDRGAMESLYRRHSARVYSVVRRLTGDDARAEDAAQEAWLRALRSLGSFRGQSLFSTWLHRIAVNCALEGERRSRRKREQALPEVVEAKPAADEPLLRRRLERAIEALPEGMRRVVVLHDVEGYTHQEIGTMLGVSEGTCKSQLFKARARLRAQLAWTREGEGACSI